MLLTKKYSKKNLSKLNLQNFTFKSEELPSNYEVLLAVKIGFLCEEVTVTVRQFPPMAEPKLFSTDNILKIQKGQNVEEETTEKDVDEHSCLNHPETHMDCLQRFHYNHRFYTSFGFEGLDAHEQLGHRGRLSSYSTSSLNLSEIIAKERKKISKSKQQRN